MYDYEFSEETIKTENELQLIASKINLILAEHKCKLISADEWHNVLITKYTSEGKQVFKKVG